jgi:hypothetical protein
VPESAQATPLPELSFDTVAVNGCVRPVCTDAVGGDSATEIAPEIEPGLSELPPPHPASTATAETAAARRSPNENSFGLARSRCARVKAVSRLSVTVFLRLKGFRGLEAVYLLSISLPLTPSKPRPIQKPRIA